MSEASSPQREFELISDPLEALKLLKEGAKTLASAMIWTKNQEVTLDSHLVQYSDTEQALYAWVPSGFEPKQLADALTHNGQQDCFFSVSLSRANIFFKCKFVQLDTGKLQFHLPDKVYKVQRRKDLRFTIPLTHTLKVEFQDPLFPDNVISRKVIDISANGLAFLIKNDEESFFPKGLILNRLSFTIRGRNFVTSAEIKHVQAVPLNSQTPGVKVGVVFRDFKPADIQYLAAYVFEEYRKVFSRYI